MMAGAAEDKVALLLHGWIYRGGDREYLRQHARRVTPEEYQLDMEGSIFCVECCVPLFRSPKDRSINRAGRQAFFAHLPSEVAACSLRTRRREGKQYDSEEEAREAIERGDLVVVTAFRRQRPVTSSADAYRLREWSKTEDEQGILSETAIARHRNGSFLLPAKVTTVRSLTRNFDENLSKYFALPGRSHAEMLRDLLTDIRSVVEPCQEPRLYYGRITSSKNMGRTPENKRQTFFEYKRSDACRDFCLKAIDQDSRDQQVDETSIGRIALMYGIVTQSGLGLCVENIGWGEFALLPLMYESLLDVKITD